MLECGIKKNVGCCSPSHEETLNDLIEKQFQMTLSFMRMRKIDGVSIDYLTDMLEVFSKYYDFDDEDLDDEWIIESYF